MFLASSFLSLFVLCGLVLLFVGGRNLQDSSGGLQCPMIGSLLPVLSSIVARRQRLRTFMTSFSLSPILSNNKKKKTSALCSLNGANNHTSQILGLH
ncbi:uncharacterized protein P884DRAFT_263548 [Thermothelomyces heterothallicus CBS 202.75]|uniref:uncharacterized protein n=1 Tax=Thermothelomyces heterothallicus CBS 202.75 TaxID=1149848 RepID=UPI0037428E68